jgi:hypothetical protein
MQQKGGSFEIKSYHLCVQFTKVTSRLCTNHDFTEIHAIDNGINVDGKVSNCSTWVPLTAIWWSSLLSKMQLYIILSYPVQMNQRNLRNGNSRF